MKEEQCERAFALIRSMSIEAREYFEILAASVKDAGPKLQLQPEEMLCGIAVIAAATLLSHLDPRDEPEVNRLIAFANDALNVTVAILRLHSRAIGERPDVSFGILPDA